MALYNVNGNGVPKVELSPEETKPELGAVASNTANPQECNPKLICTSRDPVFWKLTRFSLTSTPFLLDLTTLCSHPKSHRSFSKI
jgi:hypothetical protein